MSDFNDFWEKLTPSYPVSNAAFKLPIASKLLTIDEFSKAEFLKELRLILGELLDKHATKDSAVARAKQAGEEKIIPLIDDDFTGIVRFDCVIDEHSGKIKILELNSDYPDGLILHDKTYSVLSETTNTLHADLLKELFEGSLSAHVLHHHKASFLDAYYNEKLTLEDLLKKPVTIGGEVDADTQIIRRCLEISKLSESDCEKMARNNARSINTFAMRTLGYKDLLSSLTHTYIPQTKPLTEDISEEIISNKDSWIIKPVDGCEGDGIYFGNNHSDDEWQNIIISNTNNHYIAQEFVKLKKMKTSFYIDGAIVEKELYFDLCPHFFIKNGKIIGDGHVLMRFSEEPVVNVSKGGGIGYLK